MAVKVLKKRTGTRYDLSGLSTDTKPTIIGGETIGYGSTFYVEDTTIPYVLGGSGWVVDRRRIPIIPSIIGGIYDNGNSGAAATINFGGNRVLQQINVSEDAILTLGEPDGPVPSLTLRILNPSGFTITLSPVPTWPDGAAEDLSVAGTHRLCLSFWGPGDWEAVSRRFA